MKKILQGPFTIPLVIGILGTIVPFAFLWSLPSLPGTDAYYYALQVQWLYETGHTKIPDSSLVYYFTLPFMYLGFSGAQSALLYALSSLAFIKMLLAFVLRHPNPFLIWSWIGFSPSLLLLSYEFPKQFLALIFITLAFAIFSLKKIKWRYVLFVSFMLIAVWAHASCGLGALVITLAVCAPQLKDIVRKNKKNLLMACTLAVALVSLWLWRSGNIFRLKWELTPPGVFTLISKQGWGYLIICEFLALAFFIRHNLKTLACAMAATIPAFLPLFNGVVMSLGERFALMIPFYCYLLLFFAKTQHSKINWPRPVKKLSYIALLLFIWSAQFLTLQIFDNYMFSRYMARNTKFAQVSDELRKHPAPPLLITQLGMNYYLKYTLRIETFPYDPEPHWDKKIIWRIVDSIDLSYFYNRLSAECLKKENFQPIVNSVYIFMREDCFESFRKEFKEETDELVYASLMNDSLNPNHHRPVWLYSKYTKSTNEDPRFPALPKH